MKKVLLGLLFIFIAVLASAFILIPKVLTVSKITFMHANENALFRYLSDETKWQKWWPLKNTLPAKNYTYNLNGFTYSLSKALYQAIDVKMVNEGSVYIGRIAIIKTSTDSAVVKWESSFTTSSNPFARILNYQEAKKMRHNMEVILDSLKAFNEHNENVYGFNIHRTTIQDTFLVASKLTMVRYPSVKEIYKMVENLKRYIKRQGAIETNFPMLNVTTNDSAHYTTMVAIPTDKELADSGNISFKRMIIYKDKTVTAEVKGGPEAIKKAYKELDVFLNDYMLSTPVIHWESMITDRSKETDSTKWITKIYMPTV